MKQYRNDIAIAARVISYYRHPDKIELCFASNPATPYRTRTSSHLEDVIREHQFVDGHCFMEHCLSYILLEVMSTFRSRKKSFSICVFTDAVWCPGNPGVDRVIANAVQELERCHIPAENLVIQFIRFGDGPNERERLRHLNDDLVEQFNLHPD
jgi:hypothetical protein